MLRRSRQIRLCFTLLAVFLVPLALAQGDKSTALDSEELPGIRLLVPAFTPGAAGSNSKVAFRLDNRTELEIDSITVQVLLKDASGHSLFQGTTTFRSFVDEDMRMVGSALPFTTGDLTASFSVPATQANAVKSCAVSAVGATGFHHPKDMSVLSHWFTRLMVGRPDQVAASLKENPGLAMASDADSGLSAIHVAALSRNRATFQLILESGANLHTATKAGLLPIHFAAMFSPDIVELLVNTGTPLDTPDGEGYTPLMYAARNCQPKCAQLLMDAGANVNHQAADGRRALSLAAFYGPVETVRNLLEKGARVEFLDNRKISPLHYAAGANQVEIIDLLVSAGCDVDFSDPNEPWSPLDTACRMGKAEAARELLRLHANPQFKTKSNSTPLQVATFFHKQNVVDVLKEMNLRKG